MLVDAALAAELGLDRDDGEAIRGGRAIAAALADELVDDDAPRRRRELAALAFAALLGGACLVVDQHRDAWNVAELPLHRVELVAVMQCRARGHIRPRLAR